MVEMSEERGHLFYGQKVGSAGLSTCLVLGGHCIFRKGTPRRPQKESRCEETPGWENIHVEPQTSFTDSLISIEKIDVFERCQFFDGNIWLWPIGAESWNWRNRGSWSPASHSCSFPVVWAELHLICAAGQSDPKVTIVRGKSLLIPAYE